MDEKDIDPYGEEKWDEKPIRPIKPEKWDELTNDEKINFLMNDYGGDVSEREAYELCGFFEHDVHLYDTPFELLCGFVSEQPTHEEKIEMVRGIKAHYLSTPDFGEEEWERFLDESEILDQVEEDEI